MKHTYWCQQGDLLLSGNDGKVSPNEETIQVSLRWRLCYATGCAMASEMIDQGGA